MGGLGSDERSAGTSCYERLEMQVAELRERVQRLEGLLTPEQHQQLRLIKQAERLIEIAKAEGQL